MSLVGGTNLLNSNILRYRQWDVGLRGLFLLRKSLLLGVGWWQYQKAPSRLAAIYWKSILLQDVFHSVRDSYTKLQLEKMGFNGVINTGCPTMWNLTKEHCIQIPTEKADAVVFTLTLYNQVPELDGRLVDVLKENYKTVIFWPQSEEDLHYLEKIRPLSGFVILGGHLRSFDNLLEQQNVDYVGTRLHAGVRAIQYKKRSLIVEVDNRAAEIARDTKLSTVARTNFEGLKAWILGESPTLIEMDQTAIAAWKRQFSGPGSESANSVTLKQS